MTEPEHWFDRLTVRYTRRQTLKAAAGFAVALPLLSGEPARAGIRSAGSRTSRRSSSSSAVDPCFKGCVFTARAQQQQAEANCHGYAAAAGAFLGFSLGGLGIGTIPWLTQAGNHCIDSTVLQNKADYFDCIQPDCSGFDPKQSGGPCDGCMSNCCTCSASTNGYICCIFACDDQDHNCCPGG